MLLVLQYIKFFSYIGKNNSYLFLRERLHKHDVSYLEKVIENHLSGKDKMASLNSRSVSIQSLCTL